MRLSRLKQQALATPAACWLRSHRAISLPLLILAALGLAFGLGRHSGQQREATATRPAAQSPAGGRGLPLSEPQLQRAGLRTIRPELISSSERPLAGFVESAVGAQSRVGMPVAGRVERLLVAPGSSVQAGAVIAVVHSPEAAVARAEAEAARATAQSLEHQYRRALPMARQGALSWQELESRRIESVRAGSEARAAAARFQALGSPDASGRVRVRSPLTGQVAAVTAAPGAVLGSGAELAEIQDSHGRELRFMVSPLLAGNLTPGQVLRVKAGPRELRARVLAIAPDAASSQRLMILRAAAIDADLPPAGSAVSAFVQVPSSQQRWSVPPQAVQIVNGAAVVFRYQRGLAEPLQVVVGEQSPGGVVILQGLRGGETLLSGNTEMLSTALSNRRP